MAEGKAARKNRKRRDKKPCVGGGFTLEEEVPGKRPPSPLLVDPLTDLQRQLVQAKADKDHDKAQDLRHRIWVLQDTLQLGQPPSSAPAVDLGALISHTPPKPQATASSDPTEKKLLKLRRKMEQITSLKQRVANGESLERTQLLKISTEEEVQEEIDIIEELLRTQSFI
ncbi:uncharacterized protein LOC135344468 isoform X2 [Halichondria panicea]|uniref:uncharacterized protein LOC135344468 isoform X2 n=1 Tax=Halichondria panicea TaxID=6063 RepID=UPI00312BB5F2